MKKLITILIILGIILSVILIVANRDYLPLVGRVIEGPNESLFTTAICNKTEKGAIYCEDYEIICEGEKVKTKLATGFSVYHPEDWEDPRGEQNIENSCKNNRI